mgnify:CR=1 FL=1
MGASSQDEDRRRHSRKLVCVAAQLEADGDDTPHPALLRDISVTGALFLTRVAYDVDEVLDVVIVLDRPPEDVDAPSEVVARARVLRMADLEVGRRDVWRYRVAVTFEEDISEHRELLESLAERLAKTGLHG